MLTTTDYTESVMAKMRIEQIFEKYQEGRLVKIQVFPHVLTGFTVYFFMSLNIHNFNTELINVGGGFLTIERRAI